MDLEKGKISSSQLIYLMIGFIFGASMLLPPSTQAGKDAWMAILIGLAEALIFVLVYSVLASRFPGKTFVQISDVVYGPYLGKLVSAAFIWFLIHVASLVIGNFTAIFGLIIPETPTAIVAIIITLVCIYAVRNGIEVIARCSQIFVPLTILSILITFFLLLKDFDINNFLPILDVPISKLLWAAHEAAMFPFADTVAFLMVIPYMNNHQEIIPSVVKAVVIGGSILTLMAIQNIAIFGILNNVIVYTSIGSAIMIDIANFLTRLEILVILNFMTMGFLRISVFFYGTVLGTAQLLGLRSSRTLILPVGILIIILSLINFQSVTENFELIQKTWPLYTLPFEVGLPLITLLLAMLRKLSSEEA